MRIPFWRGRIATALPVLAVLVAAAGCSKTETSVSGKVTYKNNPITAGTVIMIDSRGAYHQGEIDANGNYTIENVALGSAKFAVAVPKAGSGKKVPPPRDGGRSPGGKIEGVEGPNRGASPEAPAQANGPDLPPNVRDPNTSNITREVKSGTPIDLAIE